MMMITMSRFYIVYMLVKNMFIGDDNTRNAITGSLNKTITLVTIEDDILYINFDDNTALRIWDRKPSEKYMKHESDLKNYTGAKLTNVYIKPLVLNEENWVHEITFLDFETTNGTFTIINHNYDDSYDSFWIEAEIADAWIPKF